MSALGPFLRDKRTSAGSTKQIYEHTAWRRSGETHADIWKQLHTARPQQAHSPREVA
jgi:hypothetical protein